MLRYADDRKRPEIGYQANTLRHYGEREREIPGYADERFFEVTKTRRHVPTVRLVRGRAARLSASR